MAEESKGLDDELGEDGEAEEGDKEKFNPELLSACMKNDTEAAIALMEKGADPCCEDNRQWSPLIWAASHGNETLTRHLIKLGAADVYKYDGVEGKVKKKKHSPLHWAAFKGHLKELWLLLGQNLSHHERDQIGNTALHQAAAGGSLECTKCLMAQGADVFAKNNRGHTPFALCTVPEVQGLLDSAMAKPACKATGKQFSSTILRYLCSWSLDVFCEAAVTQTFVYESPDATEKEKPVTWCTEVRNSIQEIEHQLTNAMHLNQLETVTAALAAAENKPVDCKLTHQCSMVKAKLESEIQLGKAMQCQVITHLDMFQEVHDTLSQAIEDAELKAAEATVLRPKLAALALMELAFRKPKKQRRLSFEELATHCRVGPKEVEHLIMKAMCAQLIKGKIDEVAAVLIITWVKPRILDNARIDVMRERMDQWAQQTGLICEHLEEMTPELLVS